jgi:hypothetical protein
MWYSDSDLQWTTPRNRRLWKTHVIIRVLGQNIWSPAALSRTTFLTVVCVLGRLSLVHFLVCRFFRSSEFICNYFRPFDGWYPQNLGVHQGVFQEYYTINLLPNCSPSIISLIGALQLFFLYGSSPIIGKVFDAYGSQVFLILLALFDCLIFFSSSFCRWAPSSLLSP